MKKIKHKKTEHLSIHETGLIGRPRKTILTFLCGCATAAAAFCLGCGSFSLWTYLFAFLISAFGLFILYALLSLVSSCESDLANNNFFIIVIIGIVLFGYLYLVIYQMTPHAV